MFSIKNSLNFCDNLASQHKLFAALLLSTLWLTSVYAPISQAQSRGISIEAKTPISKTPYAPGQFRALVIGNNTYVDTSKRWVKLNTAVADAKAVADTLSKDYGFSDVTRLVNASRRDILLALSSLSKRVLPNDSVLVFYAGHGYIDPNTDKGFWVPSDAEGSDHTTFLRNSTIRDELSIIADRSKHTLLIADSCFSGTLLRRGASLPAPENVNSKYYKKVAQKKSVQIMTSGGVEYVDDNYKNSGHSPFTYFLLNELKHNANPMVSVSEISANVTKAVANNADQTPSSGVLAGAGDELGEFIFVRIKLKIDTKGIPKDKIKISVEVEQDPESADNTTTTAPPSIVVTPKAVEIIATPVAKRPQTPSKKRPTKEIPSKPATEDIFYPMPSL